MNHIRGCRNVYEWFAPPFLLDVSMPKNIPDVACENPQNESTSHTYQKGQIETKIAQESGLTWIYGRIIHFVGLTYSGSDFALVPSNIRVMEYVPYFLNSNPPMPITKLAKDDSMPDAIWTSNSA